MKRCPLCDFIYEDDQSLCDMDGIELVPDRDASTVPAKAAAHGSAPPLKAPRRRFTVALLAGVILGAAALSAYYTSTDGAVSANRPASMPAAGRSVHARGDAATPSPTPAPDPTPEVTPANGDEGGETVGPTKGATPEPSRPRAARPKEKKTGAASGSEKKESKLGSLLNKTGRILKKPFKF